MWVINNVHCFLGRLPLISFINGLANGVAMAKDKPLELRWQCLNCYKVHRGSDAEKKALDCCGSFTQGYWVHYTKWGKQKWYGR